MSALTAECEVEMGTLGTIHLHTPSPAPGMDCGHMILEGLGSGFRVRITREDTCIVSKGSWECVGMGWHVGSVHIVKE